VREGRSSKTAEHNALFRALESTRSRHERLFRDPLAEAFLSWPLSWVARVAHFGPACEAARRIIDNRWPGVRTSVAARTRLIDEIIADLVDQTDPIEQIVILGAGFDTRAYRLAWPTDVILFEVDHPDTQRRKRELLARTGIPVPNVRFVPTDFHLARLDTSMSEAGYDRTVRSLFIWEGVTNYLSEAAVDATLRWCAEAVAGSHLIFTYIDRQVLVDPSRYTGAERLLQTLRRAGEEMTFGMDPDDLAAYLEERGLYLEDDVGAASYRRRYFGDAANAMRGHEFYRVAHARMAGVPSVTPQ
jgi:methyltransferase (TIGR00027 family)